MKIIVISLPSSQDRRQRVADLLAQHNLAFEFFDAVDGRTGEHPYLHAYNEAEFLLNRRRKAALGELGCYVSHLLVWERCVTLNQPVVVLEDDFEITGNFCEGLRYVEQLIKQVAFVRLERLESRFYLRSHNNAQFSLVKQLKIGMCATGYVLTPQGAKDLLQHGREICAPVDLYLKRSCIHHQLIHALIPPIVVARHADTLIGWDVRDYREPGEVLKIRCFIRKWTYALANLAVNLSNAWAKF